MYVVGNNWVTRVLAVSGGTKRLTGRMNRGGVAAGEFNGIRMRMARKSFLGWRFFSLHGVDMHQPRLAFPVMLHQSSRHRVRMHVVQLLGFLALRIDIEIVESRLPECPRQFTSFRERQPWLSCTTGLSLLAHLP